MNWVSKAAQTDWISELETLFKSNPHPRVGRLKRWTAPYMGQVSFMDKSEKLRVQIGVTIFSIHAANAYVNVSTPHGSVGSEKTDVAVDSLAQWIADTAYEIIDKELAFEDAMRLETRLPVRKPRGRPKKTAQVDEIRQRYNDAVSRSSQIRREFPRKSQTYFDSLMEDAQATQAATQPWKELLAWLQTLDPAMHIFQAHMVKCPIGYLNQIFQDFLIFLCIAQTGERHEFITATKRLLLQFSGPFAILPISGEELNLRD